MAIVGCRVAANTDGTYLDLFYEGGSLRFAHGLLAANGSPLDCTKIDRIWQAGMRATGGGYFRGWFDARCSGAHTVEGRLELVCGKPTPAELELLDREQASHRAKPVP